MNDDYPIVHMFNEDGTFSSQSLLEASLTLDETALIKDMMSFNTLKDEVQNYMYNQKGELTFIKTGNPFNRGQCGRVYLIDNTQPRQVFKKYFLETIENNRIKYEVFELLRELKHPNIINTIDIFYRTKPQLPIEANIIDAFTYTFVEEAPINILDMPKQYLLENFRSLEKLINILSQNGISADDLKPENTILNNERIVLADPCCFMVTTDPINFIEKRNKRFLLDLMRHLLYRKMNKDYKNRNADTLFSSDLAEEKNMTDWIAKRLRFKRVVSDYFK